MKTLISTEFNAICDGEITTFNTYKELKDFDSTVDHNECDVTYGLDIVIKENPTYDFTVGMIKSITETYTVELQNNYGEFISLWDIENKLGVSLQ